MTLALSVSNVLGPIAAADVQAPPVVTGNAFVGDTLTVTPATGYTGFSARRWQRATAVGGPFTDIAGATGLLYTLVVADNARFIRCVETWSGVDRISNVVGIVTGVVANPAIAGSGFSGATATPGDQGDAGHWAYANLPAGCRWVDPPALPTTTNRTVGVKADHPSGIAKVVFIFEGGEPVEVTAQSTHPSGVTAYCCTLQVNAAVPDGIREVRAVIYPVSGRCLVLQGDPMVGAQSGICSQTIDARANGTGYAAVVECNADTGSDDTGEGTALNPYRTIGRGLRAVAQANGNDPGGARILLQPSTAYYELTQHNGYVPASAQSRWLTIDYAAGGSAANVKFRGNAVGNVDGLRVRMLRLLVDVDPAGMARTNFVFAQQTSAPTNAHLWLDGIDVATANATTAPTLTFGWRFTYATECTFTNLRQVAAGSQLARNVVADGITDDAFSACRCILSCTAKNMAPFSGSHPDVHQIYDPTGVMTNWLVDGLTATDNLDCQGFWWNGQFAGMNQVRVANVTYARKAGTVWQSFALSKGSAAAGLFVDCMFVGLRFSQNYTNFGLGPNGVFTRCLARNCRNIDNVALLMGSAIATEYSGAGSPALPWTSIKGLRYES